MTFAKTAGAADPTQTIGEYCKFWQFNPVDVAILKTTSLNDIQLIYLVSLYPPPYSYCSFVILYFLSLFWFSLALVKYTLTTQDMKK